MDRFEAFKKMAEAAQLLGMTTQETANAIRLFKLTDEQTEERLSE